MAYELKMPQLGLTMEEGTVSKWVKHEGDEVKVTLNWTSFSGPKKLQFTLKMHKEE